VADLDAESAIPEFNRPVLFRGLSLSAVAYPLNTGLLFLGQVLAARLLTQGDFGAYSLAFSIITIAALVAQLGLPQSLLRRASAALTRGDRTEARHEIVTALLVGTGAAIVCGLLIASPLGEMVLRETFPRTAVATVAGLVGVRSALKVLESILPETLRAFRDFVRVVLFDGLLMNFLLVLALAVAAVMADRISLEEIMVIAAAVSAVVLVPGLGAIAAKLRGTHGEGPIRSLRRNPVELAMWLSTIGRVLVAQLDLLVVGALATGREVALYAVPFRLALLVGLPLLIVNQVLMPLIAGWFAMGDKQRLERTARSTAGLALLGAIVIGVGCMVLGRPLISIAFGSEYASAWPVLAILAGGQILQTWAGSCGVALMMTGHQRVYAQILFVSVAITLGLQVAGYELWGLNGVALATAGSLAAQNFIQLFALERVAGFSTLADVRAALQRSALRLRRVH
jgi:O-antigen/teichoic acid export membrane protein